MDGGRALSRGVFSSRSEAQLSRLGFLVCARLHASGDAHARLQAWGRFRRSHQHRSLPSAWRLEVTDKPSAEQVGLESHSTRAERGDIIYKSTGLGHAREPFQPPHGGTLE
jgi:hypothetical protein